MIPTNRVTTHLGQLILKDFLIPLDMSIDDLHKKCRCSLEHLKKVIYHLEDITDEDAADFAEAFGTTVIMWQNSQFFYWYTKGCQDGDI